MKIAHVCPFYAPAIGGVRQVVEELAKRQVKEGHEVHVYTSDWDKEKTVEKKYEIKDGISIHRCKSWFKIANFVTVWPSVFSKLLKLKPDIIHTHLFAHPHFVLASWAAKIKKIPHIHTTHCPWTDANRSFIGRLGMKISYNFFSKTSLKKAAKIIAITPWEISFIKKYGGKDSQIVVIPNGTDKNLIQKIKNNDFKKLNKIKSTDKVVLFFGRLNITKGPEKFVRIAKSILKERKKQDVTFVIRGPDEGMRQTVAKLIGSEKKIILLNETRDRKEIAKTYQAGDIYVMPSFREGLPLTLFEAMASSLPIVASPVNGIPFEIKQPENGFLVPYKDEEKFKQRIIELLDNEKLRKKISQNNLKRAKKSTWDYIFQKTMNVYQDALPKLN
tara:strand:+ start:23405 stop:24568 length:1164 start_codon:yes stop_codon:yes gene_type:complete